MADTMTLTEVRDLLGMALAHGGSHISIHRTPARNAYDAIDAAIKQREQDADVCVWSEDEDGNWDTGCGNMFVLTEGTPYDNEM